MPTTTFAVEDRGAGASGVLWHLQRADAVRGIVALRLEVQLPVKGRRHS